MLACAVTAYLESLRLAAQSELAKTSTPGQQLQLLTLYEQRLNRAVQKNLAGTGRLESIEQIEQRGLARAIRSDDAEDRSLGNVEADILYGFQSAKGF